MYPLLLCVHRHIPLRENPIKTVYENNNAGSHFHPLRDSFLIYKQILCFALSSLSGFFVDFGAFAILSAALTGKTGLLASNVIARILSASFNYEVNRKLVFKDSAKRTESALPYAILAIAILALNTGILYILTSYLQMNRIAAKVMTEAVLFLFSWTMQKRYVFKGRDRKEQLHENKNENVLLS